MAFLADRWELGRGKFLTRCEQLDANWRHSGETCGDIIVSQRYGQRGEGEGVLLVVAIAGYACGAVAADYDVGAQGWAGAVGAVGWGGGADELVGAGVAGCGQVRSVFLGRFEGENWICAGGGGRLQVYLSAR